MGNLLNTQVIVRFVFQAEQVPSIKEIEDCISLRGQMSEANIEVVGINANYEYVDDDDVDVKGYMETVRPFIKNRKRKVFS